MKRIVQFVAALFAGFASSQGTALAQRQMEYLDRGVVAVRDQHKTLVSWRLLGTEADDLAFDVYRTTGDKTIKLNEKPLNQGTNFVDEMSNEAVENRYFVIPVGQIRNHQERKQDPSADNGEAFVLKNNAARYIALPLQTPAGYTPNDLSVGDLDGDGRYEIIVHQTGRGRDNASAGNTDPAIFQAYKLDGTLLWTINLGKNIREGAHYTQFIVYDLDGDGRAEVCMKTADGTIDGRAKTIGDGSKDYRNRDGKILDGPEFFTVFDGLTGAALATADYIPARGDVGAWGGRGGNGGNDRSGNRVDRFLAGVAYLDGARPSVVMCRGYYGRSVLAAWDWRDRKLTSRWVFDSKDGTNPYSGQGCHALSVADVDNDGKDEIIYGAMCVDDDGRGLYTTGLRHGDALHVGDLDPARPGLEVYGVHEIEEGTRGPGTAMFAAATGEVLWSGDMNRDVGRGMSADIDSRFLGYECWGGGEGLKSAKGERIGAAPRSVNFRIWWDGDLGAELLNGTRIEKWDAGASALSTLFDARTYSCQSNNGSKATPALSADLFGDWREEVIFRTADNKELRIFTTTAPTDHRFYTLMHNPQYRLSIAWQNVGYNQPPHVDYFLGHGMQRPARPSIVVRKK